MLQHIYSLFPIQSDTYAKNTKIECRLILFRER